jgi:8-oxo-dGTP pyrophosphatase MutT (NUDIX family)
MDKKVLMVNEIDNGINCWNQPAGHVEQGEDLLTAAKREALEETGYSVEITGIQAIYQGIHGTSGTHYLRVCFRAVALEQLTETLDPDILSAQWLDLDDLRAGHYQLRSELTRQTLEDSGDAPIYPVNLIHDLHPGDAQ